MTFLLSLAAGILFAASPPWQSSLRQAVETELPGGARFTLERVHVNGTPPPGAIARVLSPRPPIGLLSFELSWTEGGVVRKAHGKATCRAWAKVAVAREPISHGTPIRPDQVSFEERELMPHALTGFFFDAGSLGRLRARGYVRTGSVLDAGNTESPADIERGQAVELIASRGRVRLVAKVVALEKGRRGEWIRVENPMSQRILSARVTGPGTAEVN